jgi:hypothetical protein
MILLILKIKLRLLLNSFFTPFHFDASKDKDAERVKTICDSSICWPKYMGSNAYKNRMAGIFKKAYVSSVQ